MKNTILDILKQKGTGFSVPKQYFESIESNLQDKLLKEKLPVVHGLKAPEDYFSTIEYNVFNKINTPNIPKGYFESLETRIFDRLKKEDGVKIIDIKSKIKRILIPLSVAATLLLLLVLTYTNNKVDQKQNLVESEIESLIDQNYISLNSYEIAEFYNDTELEELTLNQDIELAEYLNGIDVERILLEN